MNIEKILTADRQNIISSGWDIKLADVIGVATADEMNSIQGAYTSAASGSDDWMMYDMTHDICGRWQLSCAAYAVGRVAFRNSMACNLTTEIDSFGNVDIED